MHYRHYVVLMNGETMINLFFTEKIDSIGDVVRIDALWLR